MRGPALIELSNGQQIPVYINVYDKEFLKLDSLLMRRHMEWLVQGKLTPPQGATNFHTFDFKHYLSTLNIHWTVQIEQVLTCKDTGVGLYQLKANILRLFYKYDTNVWVDMHNRLLLNLDSVTYETIKEGLADWGIIHLFAISGLHINYLKKLLETIFFRLHLRRPFAKLLTFILLLLYAYIIQWPIGAIRVLLTMIIEAVFKKLQVNIQPIGALALSACILLIFQPLYVMRLDFLLSYALVFFLRLLPSDVSFFLKTAVIQWLTLLFIWPLLINLGHQLHFQQLLGVFILSPLFMYLFFPLALVTFLLIVFGCVPALTLLEKGFLWLLHFDFLPSLTRKLSVTIGYLPTVFIIGIYVVLFLGLIDLCHKRKRGLFFLILPYFFLVTLYPYLNPVSRLTVLDVGQGDAILYQPAWSCEAWLIDTGGKQIFTEEGLKVDERHAKKVLIPALRALGVRQLTGLIITHPDEDHMGNVSSLLEEIPIQHLYLSEASLSHPKLLPHLNKQVTSLIDTQKVYSLSKGKISLFVMPSQSSHSQDDSNNGSILTYIQDGSLSFLSLGDIDQRTEEKMCRRFPRLQAQFLKLGHHGSRTSTSATLLKQFNKTYALISAGKNNHYGHPHPEVLALLAEYGIPYAVTAEGGAIQIRVLKWGPARIKRPYGDFR